MTDFSEFYAHLDSHGLSKHAAHFQHHIEQGFSVDRHTDLKKWLPLFETLPSLTTQHVELKTEVAIGVSTELDDAQLATINSALRALVPWRKGPFRVFDISIDTEWRSDWKWDRVLPHFSPLQNRNVLDVGCGSGYHAWRMLGEGASWVLGIDPSPRFVMQFEILKRFQDSPPIDVIPIGIEHLPPRLNYFDTTFSMGVLYHRSSPIDHLKELRDTLKPGGELVLETLVIDGELGQVLVPDDRYAQMRNVWFIPSVPTLLQWLTRCGFENAKCVDLNQTSLDEQRTTDWMPSHSLKEFLSPDDINKTVEGYPAPLRAVIVAKRKGGK